jgi:succinate dehydrogenase / fumarate reductase membrane anchor subunit
MSARRAPAGAHYGIRDWLVQRVSAVVIAVFSLLVFLRTVFSAESGYGAWAGVFAPQPMRLLTEIFMAVLCWHAWIGIRDIWMDYVKPPGVRIVLHVFTIFWLLFCLAWSVQILWSF